MYVRKNGPLVFFRPLVLSFLLLAIPSVTSATILDPAWTESPWITSGVSAVTGMAWAPDGSGRLFLISKFGDIRIVKSGPPPTMVATPFATVSPLFTSSECGLIGIAFDPDFVSTGYVYVFATVSSFEQQIIRYTAVGDLGTNKTTILPGLPTNGANHDGGGIGFGWDGKLYWSIGDQGNFTGVNDDFVSLASKVGRANPDGSVPEDNLYRDGPGGNNDYIFARGFRNPFTLTFQPTTGRMWVDVAGNGYEQIFVVTKGAHAGWNLYENTQPPGFIPPVIKYRTNGTDMRTIQAATGAVRSGGVVTYTTTLTHGFRNGENITIAGVADPSFNGTVYVASTPTPTTFTAAQAGANATTGGGTATTLNQGGAVTGGAFYDATGAPAAYRGNFFYGDYNSGRIMRAVIAPGPASPVTSIDYFVTGNTSATDISVGPDGALYYVGIPGTVYRAAYTPTGQEIIVSNTHVFMNDGRSLAFTVRLATAPGADVTVDVARTAGSATIDVASGAALTFTPSNYALPQTVIVSSVEDNDNLDDNATFTVSSTGLTSQLVEVRALDTSGTGATVTAGAVADGDGVPGVPLTMQINPADRTRVDLLWGSSCGTTDNNYSVHEGTLGTWYSHNAVLCTTANNTTATILPAAGDRYFLVVPLDDYREGSYGEDSLGLERPRSNVRCRVDRDFTACP